MTLFLETALSEASLVVVQPGHQIARVLEILRSFQWEMI